MGSEGQVGREGARGAGDDAGGGGPAAEGGGRGVDPRAVAGERDAVPSPTCRIIAGPNGAGKTTFALNYLPQVAPGTVFINADLIAAGLSPLAPERMIVTAGRLFLQQIEDRVAAGRDFLNSGPRPEIVFVQDGERRTILNQEVFDMLVKEATP